MGFRIKREQSESTKSLSSIFGKLVLLGLIRKFSPKLWNEINFRELLGILQTHKVFPRNKGSLGNFASSIKQI